MAHTPREAAESLYAAMPHAMTLDLLREYGLEVTSEQARHITEEALSLNLYWIHTALQASLRAGDAERVSRELTQCIVSGWKDFDMPGRDHAAAFDEAQTRRAARLKRESARSSWRSLSTSFPSMPSAISSRVLN
jgi:hypothetical protein